MGTYYSSAEVAVPAPEYGYVAPESMNEEYEYGTGFNVQQDNVPGSDEAYAYYASGLIGPSSLQNESVYQDMSADDQHAAYADLSSVPLPSLSSNTKPTQDSGTRAADESDDDYVGIVDEAPQDSYGARVVDQPDYEESPSNAFGAVDLADYEVGAEVTLAQDYEASAPRLSLRPDPAMPVDTPVAVLHVGRSEAEAMLRQPSESSGSYVVRKKGPGAYVVSLRYHGRMHHYKLSRSGPGQDFFLQDVRLEGCNSLAAVITELSVRPHALVTVLVRQASECADTAA